MRSGFNLPPGVNPDERRRLVPQPNLMYCFGNTEIRGINISTYDGFKIVDNCDTFLKLSVLETLEWSILKSSSHKAINRSTRHPVVFKSVCAAWKCIPTEPRQKHKWNSCAEQNAQPGVRGFAKVGARNM